MRPSLVAAFAALLLAAPVARAGDDLRVVTFNVTNLEQSTPRWRVRALADDLARLDAEIVFLMEVKDAAAVSVLQAELATHPIARYEAFRMDLAWLDQEVVLLSRHPPTRFRRYDYQGLGVSLDRVVYADFTIDGQAIRFVAAHLKAGIQDEDAARTRNYQVRELVSDLVRPAIAAGSRVVMLGDFNDIERGVRYPNGRSPDPVSRVFETIKSGAPELRTTDADLPVHERVSSYLGYMYDHFVIDSRLSGRVSVYRGNDSTEPSDHWPLVLDLAPLDTRPIRASSTTSHAIAPASAAMASVDNAVAGKVRDEVSVRVVVRHNRPEELEVKLEHAGRSAVLVGVGEASGRNLDKRVITRAFDGLPADGEWKLTVTYRGHAAVSGDLVEWDLLGAAE